MAGRCIRACNEIATGIAAPGSIMLVSTGAFFDGGLSELFEGVPVPVPVRYRGEQEPELEEAGAIGQIGPAGRTQGPVSANSGPWQLLSDLLRSGS